MDDMPIGTTISGEVYDEILSQYSRYLIDINPFKYKNNLVLNLPPKISLPIGEDDKYLVINSSNQCRLDKIATDEYQNPNYWWIIASVNNIVNPFNVPIGTVLRIPSISNLIMTGALK